MFSRTHSTGAFHGNVVFLLYAHFVCLRLCLSVYMFHLDKHSFWSKKISTASCAPQELRNLKVDCVHLLCLIYINFLLLLYLYLVITCNILFILIHRHQEKLQIVFETRRKLYTSSVDCFSLFHCFSRILERHKKSFGRIFFFPIKIFQRLII